MKEGHKRAPLRLQRAFWTLHSLTWDGALTPDDARRRGEDTARWVGEHGGGGRLLDLGCGTGEQSFALAGSGYDVTAVDFSGGMLRRARRKALVRRPAPEFRRIDLEEPLPFPDASFDRALCVSVLQCLSSPPRFLLEVRRVLCGGGLLFLRVKARPGVAAGPSGHALSSRVFAPVKRWAGSSRFVHSFTLDGLVETMGRSGFVCCEQQSRGSWLSLVGRAV